jgi:hypothetical protein
MKSKGLPVELNTDTSELVPHLAECLRRERANSVQINGHTILFTGGIFRLVSNWNVLVPFGCGSVSVDPTERVVNYYLSNRQLITVVTPVAALPAILIWLQKHSTTGIALAALFWTWLVGGNILLGRVRFRSFLKRAIRNAPKRVDGAAA